MPNKDSILDHGKLDRDFMKEELFVGLSSMQIGKYLGIDAILRFKSIFLRGFDRVH